MYFSKNAELKNNGYRKTTHDQKKKGLSGACISSFPPYPEAKLVRCIRGTVFDVFVDLRKDSSTFGKWDSITLSEDNYKCVLIPRGFAHGFCTMTDISEVIYKVDNFYSPEHEGGILWNDKNLNVDWLIEGPILSGKDTHNMTLSDFKEKYQWIES